MKISTKGIYALEAMLDLAIHSQDGVESLKNVAERRALSDKYLEQIIGALRKADLVLSIRGAGGGYRLGRPAAEITVKAILEAVENNMIPMECLYRNDTCANKGAKCASKQFWNRLWNEIDKVMLDVTLQDLINENEKYVREEAVEYYI